MSLTIREAAGLATLLANLDEPPTAVLVTGSRRWPDPRPMCKAVDFAFDLVHLAAPQGTRLIVGDADGVDTACIDLARRGWTVDGPHRPDWDLCTDGCPDDGGAHRRHRPPRLGQDTGTYCPLAGHRRNQHMVNVAAATPAPVCLGFHHGSSRGTTDCLNRAAAAGIPTWRWER